MTKKENKTKKKQQIGMAEPKMTLKANLSAPFFRVFFIHSLSQVIYLVAYLNKSEVNSV